MGLDMFAYRTSAKLESEVDFDTEHLVKDEIAYWRKHPDLHRWMEALYRRKKGGKAEEFNCVPVALNKDDLDLLEVVVERDQLPINKGGFFFGVSQPSDKAVTLAFIKRAREEIAAGNSVFYTSWW